MVALQLQRQITFKFHVTQMGKSIVIVLAVVVFSMLGLLGNV
jgi:hypothetical protein